MDDYARDASCARLVETIRCLSKSTKIMDIVPVASPKAKRGRTATSGSLWMPRLGKAVPFGSSVERDFLLGCRLDHPITDIVSQPFTLVFSHAGGPPRRYTPDFLVVRDLSLQPSQFSTGEGEHTHLIVEAKRVEDFLRSSEADIVRLSALNAWKTGLPKDAVNDGWGTGLRIGTSRAATFAFDTMYVSSLGDRLTYFGRLAAETPDIHALAVAQILSEAGELRYRDMVAMVAARGLSRPQARWSVDVAIAQGWVGYPHLRLPEADDVLECWHEVGGLPG